MCIALTGLTVCKVFQRESGWCELLHFRWVLPLSFCGKPQRFFCVKEKEKGFFPLNLGGTTRAFVP